MSLRLRQSPLIVLALPLFTCLGCHSKYIQADITNHTARQLSVVQVDYPSASFGVQALAPGGIFHYRFKLQGNGPIKITYTDAAQTEHHQTGPELKEGQEGQLHILFGSDGDATFSTELRP